MTFESVKNGIDKMSPALATLADGIHTDIDADVYNLIVHPLLRSFPIHVSITL
jgi:hypothetical protein